MRYRWMYYMTGLPGWMRFGWFPAWGWRGVPGPYAWWWFLGVRPWWMTSEDELAILKDQQAWLQDQLKWVEERIAELEKEQQGEEVE
ncbi:MAG TPA: DUF5320 domain-containing protein [Caldilineae bacterium]|nr:DUF5320 domain-containing protein [Caldilineae bacterium]